MENKKSKLPGTILILAIGAIAIAALLWFWFINFGGTAKQANTQDDFQGTTAATTTVATTKATTPTTTEEPKDKVSLGVLNNNLLQENEYFDKTEITKIEFVDKNGWEFAEEPWDFSLEGDGSVEASLTGTRLIIAAEGGVIADADASYMLHGYTSLESIDLSGLDTSNVTDMSYMFGSCYRLEEIKGLDNFDTSNVTKMSYMFSYCYDLTEIAGLNSFDTSKVTAMDGMFRSCFKVTSLDLGSFDTSNVTTMAEMFNFCKAIEKIDLSYFDTGEVTTMELMFASCSSLERLIAYADFFINNPNVDDIFYNSAISESDIIYVEHPW